jgi:hypothetical protein
LRELRRIGAPNVPGFSLAQIVGAAAAPGGDLAEIYDRNDYVEERAAALVRWADYLDACSASNVIPIKRARRQPKGARPSPKKAKRAGE